MIIITNPDHVLHNPNGIPVEGNLYVAEEVPERVEELLQGALRAGHGPVSPPVDHGMDPLLAVHDQGMLAYQQTAYHTLSAQLQTGELVVPGSFAPRSARRKPNSVLGLQGYYAFGVGAPIHAHTWQAAYWSAQCALTAAEAVKNGARAAYALCRPPGHHAGRDIFGGFCYLNNAAIAARWLRERTAILDIDYHHGNGTQEIFYEDPQVLFCSLHADPDDDYPFYWGAADETGAGTGLGFNVNRPLAQGTSDDEYLVVLDEVLQAIGAYAPRYLVVSLGFDGALGDEVGGFAITPGGFAEIGKRIAGLELPALFVQEGGYDLDMLSVNAEKFLSNFQ